MFRILRCFCHVLIDRKGIGALETAIVVPVLLVMVMGASDLAMGFSQKLRIQQAAARAVEMATAGGASSAALSTLRAEAAEAAGVSSSNVTMDQWLECDGVRQGSFSDVCSTSGAQVARFVSITINGSYTPMFSFVIHPRGDRTSFALRGFSSVRVQ